ncbi:MAG: hypothetical protein BAA04_00945 [Firmicutes bacterium ZCTH02-B6]|nr:MAG: hypothetical protein BAA04_00945 [Firmicutes bacterium ZCTH02-B6]
MQKAAVIIPAAGQGQRMGQGGRPKQYLPLLGKPIVRWTLEACAAARCVSRLVLVVAPDDVDVCRRWVAQATGDKPVYVVAGGSERQESVSRGLAAVGDDVSLVAVHDGVRPLVQPALLDAVVSAAARHGAATAAVPVKDTVKQVRDGWVQATPERASLRLVQTPQAFHRELLIAAHNQARAAGWQATDDAALVERLGHPVAIVDGAYDNIKITTAEDLLLAETLLAARLRGPFPGARGSGEPFVQQQPGAPSGGAAPAAQVGPDPAAASAEGFPVRVGIGYDVHRFAPGRPLVLGGVEIPFEKGLAGHSDADVLLHAIMDALLGAAALGDIGRHFPDTDPAFSGASSLRLLEEVVQRVRAAGWRVGNVDATVVLERPKIAPYVPLMRERLAGVLGVGPDRVNIKATTNEGLGFVGAGDGAVAYATATLVP